MFLCFLFLSCICSQIPFSNVVYIERSDFRMQDSKDYYGLAPGKSVILRLVDRTNQYCDTCMRSYRSNIQNFAVLCRYAFPIKCTEVILAEDNETIVEIRAEYDPSKKTKPKV